MTVGDVHTIISAEVDQVTISDVKKACSKAAKRASPVRAVADSASPPTPPTASVSKTAAKKAARAAAVVTEQEAAAEAKWVLGMQCYDGTGVHQDRAQASLHFEAAVAMGSVKALNSLGIQYYGASGTDLGVPASHARAAEYFQKAADRGHEKAQCCLGQMYMDGEVPGVGREEAL